MIGSVIFYPPQTLDPLKPIEFPATRGLNRVIENLSNKVVGIASWSQSCRGVTEMCVSSMGSQTS